jgi:hypothetical protein
MLRNKNILDLNRISHIRIEEWKMITMALVCGFQGGDKKLILNF